MSSIQTSTLQELKMNYKGDRILTQNTSIFLKSVGEQSIPDATGTEFLWPNEVYDPRDLHSLTTNTNRVTVKLDGMYLVTSAFRWDTNSTGTRQHAITKNGTVQKWVTMPANIDNRNEISQFLRMRDGDYISLRLYQDSGAARDVGFSQTNLQVVGVSLND